MLLETNGKKSITKKKNTYKYDDFLSSIGISSRHMDKGMTKT